MESGKWEEPEIEWLMKELEKVGPNAKFLDVGGNLGTYSLVAATRGFNVTCIEGWPKNSLLIKKNIDLNRYGDRIKLIEKAVGNGNKDCHFIYRQDNIANGQIDCDSNAPNFAERIELRKIDDLLFEDFDVMKIDIEFKEFEAFQGMKKYFQNYKIKIIFFECTNKYAPLEFFKMMRYEYGYKIYIFHPGTTSPDLEHPYGEKEWNDFYELSLRYYNFVAIKE